MYNPTRAKGRVKKIFDKFRENYRNAGGNLDKIVGSLEIEDFGENVSFRRYITLMEIREFGRIKRYEPRRICKTSDILGLILKDYVECIEELYRAKEQGEIYFNQQKATILKNVMELVGEHSFAELTGEKKNKNKLKKLEDAFDRALEIMRRHPVICKRKVSPEIN